MNIQAQELYDKLIEDLPSLMESNINDDLEFEILDDLPQYIEFVEHEINYEREQNYDTYSKEELDKLQKTIDKIKLSL